MYMLITFLKVTAQTEEKETKMFSPGITRLLTNMPIV